MKLKIIRTVKVLLSTGRNHFKEGDVVELNKQDAERLLSLKIAEKIKETKKKVVEPEAKE